MLESPPDQPIEAPEGGTSLPHEARLLALTRALLECLPADQVSLERIDRQIYARDLWPLHTLRVTHGVLPPLPGVVVWPKLEQEVVDVLRLARAHAIPLTPYGGGSGVLGGAMPSPGGIILDLKRMDGLLELDAANGTCRVGPGLLGQHLEDLLRARGFTLGHFPSSLMTASVGGYVVTRSAGQFSSRYGKIEDMVQSLRFVSGTGEIFDTAQDSLRVQLPDLNQLFMGTEGTLGVVTEVTLRVHPAPARARYRGFRFQRMEDGLLAMRRILQAGLRPSVLRLYDELDTFIVGRGDKPLPPGFAPEPPHHPPASARAARTDTDDTERRSDAGWSASSVGRQVKKEVQKGVKSLLDRFPDVSRSAVRMAMGRPALLERLIDRLVPHELLLILGTEGEEEEVDATLECMLELCLAAGGVDLGPEPGERWLAKRYDVSYKMPRFFYMGAFVDTIEVATTWDRIPALYHAIRHAVSDDVVIMAHFSHAYPEGLSIYFSVSGLAETLEDAERRYHHVWTSALEATLLQRGTVSHHHGVGQMKAGFAAREHADFVPYWRALKTQLDPDGLLNPGKLYR